MPKYQFFIIPIGYITYIKTAHSFSSLAKRPTLYYVS